MIDKRVPPKPQGAIGQWLFVCDRCGHEYKNKLMMKEWTGLIVCNYCYTPKHPQLEPYQPKPEPVPRIVRPDETT